MIRNMSLLWLLLVSIVGSTVSTIIPIQLSYSSSAEETSDEDQQGEPAGGEEPVDEEPVDGPEPESQTSSDDLPTSDEQEETLVVQGSGEPQAEREICVTNAKGQKFCYKELKPDEACMKPINAEDPPICPPPRTEGIVNETLGDTNNPLDGQMETIVNPTGDTVSEGIAIGEKGKPADCLVKKTKC